MSTFTAQTLSDHQLQFADRFWQPKQCPPDAVGHVAATAITLSTNQIDQLFPFYLLVSSDLKIVSYGSGLQRVHAGSRLAGASLGSHFQMICPASDITHDHLKQYSNQQVILELLDEPLKLHGELTTLAQDDQLLFCGVPWITDLADLNRFGLSVIDFPIHESLGDNLFLDKNHNLTLSDCRNQLRLLQPDAVNPGGCFDQSLASTLETASEPLRTTSSQSQTLLKATSVTSQFMAASEHNRQTACRNNSVGVIVFPESGRNCWLTPNLQEADVLAVNDPMQQAGNQPWPHPHLSSGQENRECGIGMTCEDQALPSAEGLDDRRQNQSGGEFLQQRSSPFKSLKKTDDAEVVSPIAEGTRPGVRSAEAQNGAQLRGNHGTSTYTIGKLRSPGNRTRFIRSGIPEFSADRNPGDHPILAATVGHGSASTHSDPHPPHRSRPSQVAGMAVQLGAGQRREVLSGTEAIDPGAWCELQQALGGDVQSELGTLIDLYLEDARRHADTLVSAYAQHDAEAMIGASHALRSPSATLAALRLASWCGELEDRLRHHPGQRPSHWLHKVLAEVERVCAALVILRPVAARSAHITRGS